MFEVSNDDEKEDVGISLSIILRKGEVKDTENRWKKTKTPVCRTQQTAFCNE
jgi:hypothetical protein